MYRMIVQDSLIVQDSRSDRGDVSSVVKKSDPKNKHLYDTAETEPNPNSDLNFSVSIQILV